MAVAIDHSSVIHNAVVLTIRQRIRVTIGPFRVSNPACNKSLTIMKASKKEDQIQCNYKIYPAFFHGCVLTIIIGLHHCREFAHFNL